MSNIQRVLVFGGTGMTGLMVVQAALDRGLNVKAMVRNPDSVPDTWGNVKVVKGDVTIEEDVKGAMVDADAVIVALGTRNNLEATTVLSDGMRNIIAAMKAANVEVISVCLSAFLFRAVDEVPAVFRDLNADHQREFDAVKASGLKYIAVFPPHIDSKICTDFEIMYDKSPGRIVSKQHLGKFLVDSLFEPKHYGRIVGISSSGVIMLPTRIGGMPGIPDNPLSVSWHDSAWIPILNTANVMDYFSERSNPFFDRTCNNEIVKMQRLNPDQLQNMTGLEYVLLHVQEPILYVIRKQHRHSPQQVTPLADYYIIAGTIYQAPDLASVLNSRLLSCVHHLQLSFEEASSFSRYHPSKGYSWDFKSQRTSAITDKPAKPKEEKPREEPSSLFQRQRVDMLLGELIKKYPIPTAPVQLPPKATANVIKTESENGSDVKDVVKVEIKQEKIKPPPEKKARLN